MRNNKDQLSKLIISINLMLQRDRSDKGLDRLLEESLQEVKVEGNLISLKFKNGIGVKLSSFYDDYNIYISEYSLYEKDDTPFTLYGVDRVFYYLNKISNQSY